MKKLLILMTMAVLLSGATGCACCRICDWFRRPAAAQQQCPPVVAYSTPVTTVNACDPCACSGAPVMTTGQ